MPYYVQHMQDILDEADIPYIKAYRARIDQYVQEILGTHDLEPEEVWAVLQPKLQDSRYRSSFIQQLKAKWEQRDWRQEGLGS